MKIHHDADADLAPLRGAQIALIGYGNQGRAHALNLRDSGLEVIVGQRPGPGAQRARDDGFSPCPVPDTTRRGNLVILALPDDAAPRIYAEEVSPHLAAGAALGFIHGYNIHFRRITPPATVDVIMVAPKGPGALLRSAFAAGRGIAGLIAVAQDATGRAKLRALAWARGIGCTRVGVIETSFAQETITDLFGEQAVLCGGMTELMKAAFDTLTAAGYPPELAYIECIHEMKQIGDLIYAHGIEGMRERISSTARYGGLLRGPQVVDDAMRARLKALLSDIEEGRFAARFSADLAAAAPSGPAAGAGPEQQALTEQERRHPAIEARRNLAEQMRDMFRESI